MLSSKSVPGVMQTDFIVIGAGIAGLRAAITLAQCGSVIVVTKEQLGESNTSYAQGGIAVAISGEEDVDQHLADTLAAGQRAGRARAGRRGSRARWRTPALGDGV